MANNVNLSFPPAYNQQFLNANGKPYANGRLYTYKAGTRESIVTYKTIGSTDTANMNTNPIILDMAGRAEVVLEKDKSYKFVLTDRFGTFVKLWDNISANSGEGGGGGEEYTASLPIVIDENNNISNNGANLSVSGANSWAEGYGTKASGNSSHAEGMYTEAEGNYSHAEGWYSKAVASYSHAEGGLSESISPYSHSEGYQCVSGNEGSPESYRASHAEGHLTKSTNSGSHSEGVYSEATGGGSHAEGVSTKATGDGSHAEGTLTESTGHYSHSEGYSTKATEVFAHAEGDSTKASGVASHTEGSGTTASGALSHAEGNMTVASGTTSHAEGDKSVSSNACSHAEGFETEASQGAAHAEGRKTKATGAASHAEGEETIASGANSHAGGQFSQANNQNSFAHGLGVIAVNGEAVFGKYNDYEAPDTRLFSVGDGTDDNHRKTVFKVDASGNTWVMINNTLTQITSLGGGIGTTIYGTLQNAITDAANLSVGDYFETNGFHTSGDMGASRYLVTDTGTANGMDIVSLATGKLAVLQNRLEAYPEQLGYDRYSQQDLTPVLERMVSLNIRKIKLRDCGSDNYPYLMKTSWNVNSPDIEVIGFCGFTTGYAPRIWFNPTSYGTSTTPMFNLTQRGFKLKNCVLMNRPWFTSSDSHNCVCIQMAVNNTNNMWYEFEELAIQGFDVGILNTPALDGSGDGLQWHCTFKKLAMALNNKNVYFKGLTYLTRFENCFFTVNRTGSQSISLEESFTIEFDCCNFGIYNPADTIVKFNKWVVASAPVDMRYTSAKFTNCNFEIESDESHPLPTSNKGYFFKFDDDDDFHVEIDNSFFISTPLARQNIYGNRAISLGNHTTIKISNSCGSYADVNYSGNEFYEWDFQKRIFDESRPPRQELESVILEHCEGIIVPPNFAWGHIYIPCVKSDLIGSLQCDNSTDFVKNFPNAKDGVMLFNMDGPNLVVKNGGSLVQVTSPASNKVKIGDRIYNYVVIDGRKWITENLQLYTMGTRQYRDYNHQDFGFYYGTDSFAEIDALLPTGWRRPNAADCMSLVSQGYAALQSTGYSVWPNATNSSGFSAVPSDKYNKPNTTPTFNRVWFWGPEDSGIGWKNIWIRPSNVDYSGWTYSDAASKQCNIRVCCDA